MRRLRKSNQKGFTMIELMVVVIIVGILAAIAIPLYGKYVENARTTEATGRMAEILTSAKAFVQENEAWPQNSDDGTGLIDLSGSDNFTYSITTGGGDPTGAFQVTGTGVAGTKMEGATVTLDVTNVNATGDFSISLP